MNPSRKRPGLLFTLVGPAGAGKNRLMKSILERTSSLHQLPTATTRPIREGEQEGREHIFVSRPAFQQMIETSQLLEHQVIHGNWYGMPRAAVESALDTGKSVIADIEVLGAAQARKLYPANVVPIFIQVPSLGILIQRMRERREREAEIGKRLLRVPLELEYACNCEYVILNDSFERASEKLYQIVTAELNGTHAVEPNDPLVDYQYHFEVVIIPLYHDQVLQRSADPAPLIAEFMPVSELPHQAALRALRQELHLTGDLLTGDKPDGDYLPPLSLEYSRDDQTEYLRYVYGCRLEEHVEPPAGWSWKSVQTLPEILRHAVLESQL